jgi:hypothetical protein
MDEIATAAATAFCRKYENTTKDNIEVSPYPEQYFQHSIPFLTVWTLHRQTIYATTGLPWTYTEMPPFLLLPGCGSCRVLWTLSYNEPRLLLLPLP